MPFVTRTLSTVKKWLYKYLGSVRVCAWCATITDQRYIHSIYIYIWRTEWNPIALNVFNIGRRVVDERKMRHAYMGWWNATSLHSLTLPSAKQNENEYPGTEKQKSKRKAPRWMNAVVITYYTPTTACRHHSAINSLYVPFFRLLILSCCQFLVRYFFVWHFTFFSSSSLSFFAVGAVMLLLSSLIFFCSHLLAFCVFCLRIGSNWAEKKPYLTVEAKPCYLKHIDRRLFILNGS